VIDRVLEGYVPRQQVVDPADGMVGDTFEDMVEVEFRIEAVELGGAEQRIDDGGAFATGVRACEEIVLTTERNHAQRPFGGVVVDLQMSIVDVASQRLPAREGIADRRSRR